METSVSESISVVIPVYNEEASITEAVKDGLAVLSRLTGDGEIIIVESGSTDNSAAVTDNLAEENERVKVIHQGVKKGLGSALKEGFGAARGEFIFYMDGDNPFRMSEFERGFPLLQEADLICGYRVNRQDTFVRAVYSKVFNLMMRTLFGVKVRDVQIGFKMMRKSIFGKVQLQADSMFIDAELLIKAQKAGYRIAEMGVEYLGNPSGKSSVTPLDVLKIARDLVKYKIRGSGMKTVNQTPEYHFHSYFSRRHLAHIIHKKRFDKIISLIPEGSFVLDAGCGSGIAPLLLYSKKACTGVGIDIRKEYIEFALRNVPKFQFYQDDIQSFSLAQQFDVVLCLEVIEHFTPVSQAKIIDRLDAHLKAGGLLILESPSKFYFIIEPLWKLLRKLLHPFTVFCDEEYHRLISWEELTSILEQRGYTVGRPQFAGSYLIKYIIARKNVQIDSAKGEARDSE